MGGERMSDGEQNYTAQREKLVQAPARRRSRRPLLTTVIGSYPFPGWLEFASQHLQDFGDADIEELRTDAVIVAVHDQLRAGLDVITDGEQTRYDFNLSFYGRLEGISSTPLSTRRFGPPAHDQRRRYAVTGMIVFAAWAGSRCRIQASAASCALERTNSQGQRARTLHPERPN